MIDGAGHVDKRRPISLRMRTPERHIRMGERAKTLAWVRDPRERFELRQQLRVPLVTERARDLVAVFQREVRRAFSTQQLVGLIGLFRPR